MNKRYENKIYIKLFIVMLMCAGIFMFKGIKVSAAENENIMYFFNNGSYIKYDFNTDKLFPGYPAVTRDRWPNFPWTTFDTAFTAPNGKIYFFKGSEYLRYDIATDQVDQQPLPIAGNWPGINWVNIDTALYWPSTGKVYFFKGDQYIRYDFNTDTVEAQLPISGNWRGLTYTNIDSAIVGSNGKAYFFKGDKYVRFDIASDQVDQGEQSISEHWNFPYTFTKRVDAIVTWPTYNLGQQVVDYAKTLLGKPYAWGATGPNSFDCSGLTYYTYRQFGVALPRVASDQYNSGPGQLVSKSALIPGDLVFFVGSGGTTSKPGHVGIYIGNDQYIQAPGTGDVVKISTLSTRKDYIGARRPY